MAFAKIRRMLPRQVTYLNTPHLRWPPMLNCEIEENLKPEKGPFLMRLLRTTLLAAVLGWGIAGGTPAQAAEPFGEYQYGPHWRNTLDVYVPSGQSGPHPLVVYLHGGSWLTGDKSDADQFADRLLARGMAVASLNYRYSQNATFPAQIHDCKGALRWLRAHASDFNIDANRIGVFGESAGAHLAALLALTGGNASLEGSVGGNGTFSSEVSCMVAASGTTDLFALVDEGGSMETESQLIGRSVPEIFANINTPSYANWVALVRAASPTWHASSNDPPTLILHGTEDDLVPFEQSQLLFDALLDDGVAVAFQTMPNIGHALPTQYELQIFDFFQQHLEASPGPVFDVINGSSSGDAFGTSIAMIDDVNGDGVADILVGAPYNDQRDVSAGRATLYSGASGTILRTFYGRTRGDLFGFAVASAGDVNNDGRGDLIVGAPAFDGAGNDSGRVYLFSGGNGAVLRSWTGQAAGDRFGRAVARPGDVDGDGTSDVLIGAPFADIRGSASGSASVYSGATGSRLLLLHGVRAGDRFGQAVTGGGDLNSDGRPDIIVASPFYDPSSSRINAGRILVYGKTGDQWSTRLAISGQMAGENFGFSISGNGDLTGDGIADFVVGAPGYDGAAVNNGLLRIYSGATGSLVRSVASSMAQANQGFGVSLAIVSDVSGDGRADVAVGSTHFHTNGVDVGRVVVLGNAGATVAKTVVGNLADSQFGFCLVDGTSKLVIGSPSMRVNGTNSGACLLYSTQSLP